MRVIDPGHKFSLLTRDGKLRQNLQFVKRFDPKDPKKYIGNTTHYPGTTLQDVLLCLCNRIRYVQNQLPCVENEVVLVNLQQCLMMLEKRAAKQAGLELPLMSLEQFEMANWCPHCGHVICHCGDLATKAPGSSRARKSVKQV